ncbi:hypothetical protein OOZ51_11215 [Arthrobacter sp. MI7-26]|uniref:hypothetical protein n=1 Tax=Arthrobacter sp. MI7-26 TaxID=2993653 RepID=UPI0022488170|nr:hypothetical protein [Arthrobacter sp. MI7-26]MCX2748383.1 hypothetical protein [Arthrobacter sp. MI7-26]
MSYLSDEVLTLNASVTELNYRCLADNGFPEFVAVLPAQKANKFRTIPPNLDFKAMFDDVTRSPWFETKDDAKALGYGRNAKGLDTRVVVSDPAFLAVAKECGDKVQAKLPGSHDVLATYADIGVKIIKAINDAGESSFKASSGAVYDCMAQHKFPVSSTAPNRVAPWGVDFGVPLGSQPPRPPANDPVSSHGVNIIPAVPGSEYAPSAEEKESATIMFNCSIETGVRTQWKKSVDDAIRATLAENQSSLDSLRTKLTEMAKAASDAVA